MKPTIGAVCFALLMFLSMLVPHSRQHSWLVGVLFIAISVGVAFGFRHKVEPYSSAAIGIGVFAIACGIYGIAFAAV